MSAAAAIVSPEPLADRPSDLWSDAWRRLRRNRAAVAAAYALGLVALLTVLAPWLPGLPDPAAQDLKLGATPPSWPHPFGTDELGRDTFARTLYGGRISLLVGIIGTLVSLLIGVTYGAVSGYLGGRTDETMMRFVDILYSLPYIFLVILLLVFFSRSLIMLFVALGLVQWLTMARIVRGQVLSLKTQTFVEAARALGARNRAIIFLHHAHGSGGHLAGSVPVVPGTRGPATGGVVGHVGLRRRQAARAISLAGGVPRIRPVDHAPVLQLLGRRSARRTRPARSPGRDLAKHNRLLTSHLTGGRELHEVDPTRQSRRLELDLLLAGREEPVRQHPDATPCDVRNPQVDVARTRQAEAHAARPAQRARAHRGE
jgi:ABC-type methionine transport system permease subunit